MIAMQAAAPSRITCGNKSKTAFRQDSCTLALSFVALTRHEMKRPVPNSRSPANTTEPKKSVTQERPTKETKKAKSVAATSGRSDPKGKRPHPTY